MKMIITAKTKLLKIRGEQPVATAINFNIPHSARYTIKAVDEGCWYTEKKGGLLDFA